MLGRPLNKNYGFTLIELLVVIAIIGVLGTVIFSSVGSAREAAYEARANAEFRSFVSALQIYLTNNFTGYPPDVDRGIPPGIEENLPNEDWPNGPWPNSIYDWDVFDVGSETAYQLSIRFCPQNGDLSDCRFPNQDWAENFDVNSSYFYCFDGPCQAHPEEDADYPGYCFNCDCKQMEECG
jgi:prepilin-type N-terminal cleavage/methylation domain-containing protein